MENTSQQDALNLRINQAKSKRTNAVYTVLPPLNNSGLRHIALVFCVGVAVIFYGFVVSPMTKNLKPLSLTTHSAE